MSHDPGSLGQAGLEVGSVQRGEEGGTAELGTPAFRERAEVDGVEAVLIVEFRDERCGLGKTLAVVSARRPGVPLGWPSVVTSAAAMWLKPFTTLAPARCCRTKPEVVVWPWSSAGMWPSRGG